MGFLNTSILMGLTAVSVLLLPNILRSNVQEDKVFGSCSKDFKDVEAVFRSNFHTGLERGSALSVYYRGEAVCDMWGGYADETILRPWQRDTLGLWCSTSKGIGALALLKLHDSNLLDYNQTVSHYWPEFAQGGKDTITVAQLLSHSAGLASLDVDLKTFDILKNPDKIRRALEKQVPNWTPGTANGYHGATFGLLMDELVKRVDPKHRSLQNYFQEEIAKPYDIDFYFGTPLSEHHRIARFMGMGLKQILSAIWKSLKWLKLFRINIIRDDPFTTKAFFNPMGNDDIFEGSDQFVNWPEMRVIPSASFNGYGTARAVAKLYGMVANGGGDFVKPSSVEIFNTPLRTGMDLVLPYNLTYGVGFNHFYDENQKSRHRVGTPGYGGQMGFADINHQFSYAYVTNYPQFITDESDERVVPIRKAIYDSIKKKISNSIKSKISSSINNMK